MEGMFGDHVKWEEIKVYSAKNRPTCELVPDSLNCTKSVLIHVISARPRERCPVTGLAANYLDPRTGVPYANLLAFQEISKILAHDYVWNEEFGCYVGQEEDEDEMQED